MLAKLTSFYDSTQGTGSLPVMEDSTSEEDTISLRASHWFIIAMYLTSITMATIYFDNLLPDPLSPNRENGRFSELRARRLLYELSNFGPKPAGSEACERNAVNHILLELNTIKATASVRFEIDNQNPSGCFDLPRYPNDGFTVCYRNISNIVVRLSKDQQMQKKHAVLLNCHYDSWPTSSGGSDDVISCSLMMELIRLLVRQPDLLIKYDVIFLFNGAEESNLQGAHGFITQHRWRHYVQAFINLDASGSGGRELLFQAGPSNQWLLNSYISAAVYPHCNVIAQEIFQSGLFPGTTDFRIFRDHGKIPGLDLAFVQNGYWWHTEFDEARRITPGSLQRAGDNVYATLLNILQSPYLNSSSVQDDQKYVFFDILGLFVIIYSQSIANAINVVLIVAVFLKVSNHILHYGEYYREAVIYYFTVIFSMSLVAISTCYLTLFIWGAMPWYSIHGLALLIYAVPVLWTGIRTMMFLRAKIEGQSKEDHAVAIENVHQVIVAVILAVCTFNGIASGYLFTLILLPIVKDVIPLKSAWATVFIYLLLNTPSFVMWIYLTKMLLSIFIPIMGRTVSNPELLIAAFTTIPVFVIVLSLLPLLTLTTTKQYPSSATLRYFIIMMGGILFAIAFVLYVLRTIHRSPYSYSDAYPIPRRIQLFHVNRQLYRKDEALLLRDSRLYVIAHDYRGVDDIPFVDENYSPLSCKYENPYCEVPLYFPTKAPIQDRFIRYKVQDEALGLPLTKLTMLNKEDQENKLIYNFLIRGGGQMSVFVVPQGGWQIANCSLSQPKSNVDDRPLFIFLTCSGSSCADWTFRITLKHPDTPTKDDESQLLLGVATHYLHGPQMQSMSMKRLLVEINTRRQSDPAWAITASAWNVNLIYQLF